MPSLDRTHVVIASTSGGLLSSLLDLSPDGRRLATHDFDRGFDHILIYDIDVKSWQERLCEIVGRDLTKEERATYLPGHPRLRACG
jgi:hypothetical protein